jgi:hypothetical protein
MTRVFPACVGRSDYLESVGRKEERRKLVASLECLLMTHLRQRHTVVRDCLMNGTVCIADALGMPNNDDQSGFSHSYGVEVFRTRFCAIDFAIDISYTVVNIFKDSN